MSELYSKQAQLGQLPVPQLGQSCLGACRALLPFDGASGTVGQLLGLAGPGRDADIAQQLLQSRAASASAAPASSWLFKYVFSHGIHTHTLTVISRAGGGWIQRI